MQLATQGVEDFRAMRSASAKRSAFTGMIMNSWMSIGLSACTPPLMMIHHRHRSSEAWLPADIAIEWQASFVGRRFGDRQRHAEDGVGAQPALVGRTVELDHGAVDLDLLERVQAGQEVHDLAS